MKFPENIQVKELNHAAYEDKLTGQYQVAQVLTDCRGPIDRIYQLNEPAKLVDSKWQRVIEIRALNTGQWVLWNPGKEIASTMADVHRHGQREFVCLEAANTQWQVIEANETLMIGQQISVADLYSHSPLRCHET